MPNATLKNTAHHRGITTVYLPDHASGKDDAGNAKKTRSIPFFRGKARDIEGTDHTHLKEKGLI